MRIHKLIIFVYIIYNICFANITEKVLDSVLRIHYRNDVFKNLELDINERTNIIQSIEREKDKIAILALISAENFWQNDISPDGCIGIMQVGMDTIDWCKNNRYVPKDSLLSQDVIVKCGISYFKYCKKILNKHFTNVSYNDIVHAYNAGINKCIKNKLSNIVFLQTKQLINRFNFYYTNYSRGIYEVYYKKGKYDVYTFNTININLKKLELYYNSKIYKIGAGKKDSNNISYTPKGTYRVLYKILLEDEKTIYGSAFIRLNKKINKRYLGIHGTDDENSIGKYKSSACIRLNEDDIIELYNIIDIGDYVIIK